MGRFLENNWKIITFMSNNHNQFSNEYTSKTINLNTSLFDSKLHDSWRKLQSTSISGVLLIIDLIIIPVPKLNIVFLTYRNPIAFWVYWQKIQVSLFFKRGFYIWCWIRVGSGTSVMFDLQVADNERPHYKSLLIGQGRGNQIRIFCIAARIQFCNTIRRHGVCVHVVLR